MKPKILLTLSWDVSDEKTIQSTLRVIAETQKKFTWLIRLHPSMISEKETIIEMLKSSNINSYDIEIASNLPLYTILENVDLHITHSSSTVLEAVYFGVQSIITSEYGWMLLLDQVDGSQVFKAFTEKDILNNIEQILTNKKEKVATANIEQHTLKQIKQIAATFQL